MFLNTNREKYIFQYITIHDFFSIMVGDLQRIDVYGKNGFQIAQEIPDNVWKAYNKLVDLGYTEQLIKS